MINILYIYNEGLRDFKLKCWKRVKNISIIHNQLKF